MKSMAPFKTLLLILFIYIGQQARAQALDSIRYHDGGFESQWGSSTGNDQFRLLVRVTPNGYPAQLVKLRAYFRNSVTGAQFKWVVYTDPNSLINGGVNQVYMSPTALPNPAANGMSNVTYLDSIDLTASNLTINSGDFYVGVSEANNNGFLGLAIDNAPATSAYNDRQWQYLFGGWSTLVNQASSGQFGVTAFFTPTSTGINEQATSANIQVSPNPATNTVRLTLPEDQMLVRICDAQGRLINETPLTGKNSTLDLSAYAPGLYFLTASSATHQQTIKLLRQ
jgi:hypothetical protein